MTYSIDRRRWHHARRITRTRDLMIIFARLDGARVADIADAARLGRPRVYQILKGDEGNDAAYCAALILQALINA